MKKKKKLAKNFYAMHCRPPVHDLHVVVEIFYLNDPLYCLMSVVETKDFIICHRKVLSTREERALLSQRRTLIREAKNAIA